MLETHTAAEDEGASATAATRGAAAPRGQPPPAPTEPSADGPGMRVYAISLLFTPRLTGRFDCVFTYEEYARTCMVV